MGRRKQRTVSSLVGKKWSLEGIEDGKTTLVRLANPTGYRLLHVDALWPSQRRESDLSRDWEWTAIMRGASDQFALVGDSDETLALWCSFNGPLSTADGVYYLLNCWEVAPRLRGTEFSPAVFALIACRALESGCKGLILHGFQPLGDTYRRLGGVQRNVQGVEVEEGLVSWTYDEGALTRLRGYIDAFFHPTEES